MLVMTAKLTRRKVIAGVLIVSIFLGGLIVLFSGSGGDQVLSVSSEISVETMKEIRVKTSEDRKNVLSGLGWEIASEPLEFMEVRIPIEFDATYSAYNEVQKTQGFDLQKYAGKHVMKYSYAVENHPSGEENVIATILVYKNKLIGGDVASSKPDGFLHGLEYPKE